MPDGAAGGYATIAGTEIVNDQRCVSYAQNMGLPFTLSEGCWCSNIQELAGCEAATGYSLPATDEAPWYDAAIPESGDFAGFLTAEFEGLGSTYIRTATDILTGGAVLGRLRPRPRTLTWRGYLFGRNACAVLYGLRWLTATLADAGGCDGCGEAELDVLYCCPATAEDNCETPGLPPQGLVLNDDAFRTFHRVGLVEGPTIISERKIGCGDHDGCQGSHLIEIEFSLVAGNPYMHRQPVPVCVNGQLEPCCEEGEIEDCVSCSGTFIEGDGAECEDPVCPAGDPNCLDDEFCPHADIPVISSFVDDCGCDILIPTTFCCSISNDHAGEFFESVPIIEISAGTAPLRNIEIRIVENPQERDCGELIDDPCFFCESLRIRYIPANTTIQIDGTTKRITAICPGNDQQPAEGLTLSPFSWPVLKCINYCICIIGDCLQNVPSDHSINIFVVPREM